MKIPALRIEINGELVAVAGAENLSLLTGQVGFGAVSSTDTDPRKIVFSVIGLDISGPRPRQLKWCDDVQLKSGDKVTFQLVEVEHPSPPSSVRGSPSTEELASPASAEKQAPRKRSRDA